ncbi:deoxyadenosine kinase [Bacillus sp. JCM 19046]|uniref:Deoxyguanosine kinase n=1 Tax=Shouchella xiaoxiensis TaxID=766895 RepID=A0ABS2SV66_9BACI|nr:deoxynucleoside kinase [Shouchella xiaoxiensis]MBM7838374.1 deoxyguanosine kinase [Shouchella xiaoxiensis]GAF14524.1 deoxyadenosine kinase [Bacillus sp. JCM 19045]GAF19233.1 deoxyadenosine kinase [Bacillus sp. JCM 19046]
MTTPFICIEGVIGVGKTTLTKAIAKHFQVDCLLEIVEENPYLEKFYEDMDAWSFQTEMFFLCNRVKQLEDIHPLLLQGRPVVSDYHLTKNVLFARRTLQLKKWKQYERIYQILNESLPQASVIIYLKASVDTLMERIQHRGRAFELKIDRDYIAQLASDYDEAMNTLKTHTTVITIETDHLNVIDNQADLNFIIDQVQPYISSYLN